MNTNRNKKDGSLEQSIRSIVREELANVFSNIHGFAREESADEDLNAVRVNTTEHVTAAPRKRGKKKGAGKGRVTSPDDGRLKQNRESEAEA